MLAGLSDSTSVIARVLFPRSKTAKERARYQQPREDVLEREARTPRLSHCA